MLAMMKYEIKKVFSRTGSKFAILLLLVVLGITCWLAAGVTYVNNSGVTETGFSAVRQLRSVKKEWAGLLDEEKIRAVIEENGRIASTPEAQSNDYRQNDIAYSWKQGFSDIRDLLNYAYADGFREYNYYKADSLTTDDAKNFYQNRIVLLQSWLDEEAKDQFSDAEKSYLLNRYEALDTPFIYDYSEGWHRLFQYSPTIIMITMLILGYLVAGVFSGEFQWKSDAVFFTSFYGRNKAVTAKIKAGFYIVTAVYWVTVFLYSCIVFLYLGIDGAGCPIQADMAGWKSFYNITLWQEYLLIVAGGYLGCLFMAFLTMLVSAKTRSTVIAVIVPFALIFLPSFIGGMEGPVISKVLGVLPDRLLQVSNALSYFELYRFGGKIVGAVPVLLIMYGILAIILLPMIYYEYSRKQIS